MLPGCMDVNAWEGKNPGGVRVLLANPKWEKGLLRYLEVTGVVRAVYGVDIEESGATWMDGRILWQVGDGGAPRAPDL
jgi:hypothetical protein